MNEKNTSKVSGRLHMPQEGIQAAKTICLLGQREIGKTAVSLFWILKNMRLCFSEIGNFRPENLQMHCEVCDSGIL